MGAKSNSASLHVVTGNTPLPPKPPIKLCHAARCPMPSKPIIEDDASVDGVPTSNMLLTSLCDAWHDIGDRAAGVLGMLQPSKMKPV